MRATAQRVCSYNVANAIDTTRKVQHLIISSHLSHGSALHSLERIG